MLDTKYLPMLLVVVEEQAFNMFDIIYLSTFLLMVVVEVMLPMVMLSIYLYLPVLLVVVEAQEAVVELDTKIKFM